MAGDKVWRKTPKGVDAIVRRTGGLSPRLRSALILVDGKRRASDLARLTTGLGSPNALLAQLASGGFIEPMVPGWIGPLPQAPTLDALTLRPPWPAPEPTVEPVNPGGSLPLRGAADAPPV